MNETENFGSLGLSPEMLAAVESKGFERPTAVQQLTIPKILNCTHDLIAQSQTGTGKTAAYGLPVMQLIERGEGGVKALVLVPTRELALQVTQELHSYNAVRRLSIVSIYGGASIGEQLRRLRSGADIVVGTPGRILDHIRRGTLLLSGLRYLVLDEADEMLNMGFIDDVEEIMSHAADDRRVFLFSATMPQRIVRLAETYMHDTEQLRVESAQITADLTDQIYFEVRECDKFDALTRIIDITPDFYGIVFGRTKVGVDELVLKLGERGYAVEGLHGDVSQAQREQVLRKFRNRQVNILVATDVAARGIDIDNLTHVINYSLPQDSESYVHRIGRTGRAGRQGTAITFISRSEMRHFGFLRRDIKAEIRKENLPSPQDIVAMKRSRIMEELAEIVSTGGYADFSGMASGLLAEYEPEVALGALLRLAFRSELDESSYPEIRSFSVDRKGTARLFLAIGKKDGYDVRKLVALLKRECGLRDKHINDIRLGDDYSFVSVPFADSEEVISRLNKLRHGSRPLAEIARPDAARTEEGRKERRDGAEGGPAEEGPGRGRHDGPREDRRRGDRGKNRDYGKERCDHSRGAGSDWRDRSGRGEEPRRYGPRDSGRRDGRDAARRHRDSGLPRTEEVRENAPSSQANSGFDWSFFEKDGNSWDRPDKKRKKR